MNAVKVVGAARGAVCVLLLSSVMLMRHSLFACLLVSEAWFGENKDGSVRVRCAVGARISVLIMIGVVPPRKRRGFFC